MKRTDKPVIVEEIFDVNISTVWKAVTEQEEMIEWFFENIPEFKTDVGFKTEFNVISGERNFLHKWEILSSEFEKEFLLSWKYEDYDGLSHVRFELISEGGKTRLRLTNKVVEDFSDSIQEFRRESCIGGWQYFINGNLKKYLSQKN